MSDLNKLIPNNDFNFFDDLTVSEQNLFLRTYLTETTKYLKAIPFSNSPDCFYYEHVFVDNDFHGNTVTNLSTLLILLIQREYLWPIKFLKEKPNNNIFYLGFTSDFKLLHDLDISSFEYFDIDQAAKILEN